MTIEIHPTLINFVKPDAHSKYSPSSADRWWGGCPYSIEASVGVPEESNEYAEEGTLGHSVAEAVFREREVGIPMPYALSLEVSTLKDNGDEMIQAGNDFYDIVKYWMNNRNQIGDILWFGQERGIPVFPEESCYGTGDFVIVGSKASVVIDFKYGRKPVEACCKQLKVYAAGIARHINKAPKDYGIFAVIHQPRANPSVKEHYYPIQEMYNALESIWESIHIAKRKDLEPVEDSKHCFWCPLKRTTDLSKRCSIIMNKPLKLAQERFSTFMADSNLVPDSADKKARRDEAIIKLMTLLPAIEEVVEQSKDDFQRRLEAGEHIPGVVLNRKYGNRILNAESDEDAAAMIIDMFPGVQPWEVVSKTKIKALGKIEKIVGKGNLDPLCVKKVSKEVCILDEKQKSVINSMSQFAQSISNS